MSQDYPFPPQDDPPVGDRTPLMAFRVGMLSDPGFGPYRDALPATDPETAVVITIVARPGVGFRPPPPRQPSRLPNPMPTVPWDVILDERRHRVRGVVVRPAPRNELVVIAGPPEGPRLTNAPDQVNYWADRPGFGLARPADPRLQQEDGTLYPSFWLGILTPPDDQ